MKAFDSDAPEGGLMDSPPTSTFPSPTEISDPARTLWVVDDDRVVRQLLAQLLSSKGYQVLQAENRAEALQVAGATATIHLLLTDFSMPGGNGLDLTRQFRTLHPKTPVLMVSGSSPQLLGNLADLDQLEILDKPFEFDELFHKVRTLVDAVAPLPRRKL
jgi:two-component system, cell cycle sensor histidine kinase and response regulator CckA